MAPSKLGAATVSVSATVLGTASAAGETLRLHVTTTVPRNVCTSASHPQLNTTCSSDLFCALLDLQSSPTASPPYTPDGTAPAGANQPNGNGALVYTTCGQWRILHM